MSIRLSEAISERYQLALSNELRDWMDGSWARFGSDSEFGSYNALPSLVDRAPDILWPGFMLPDTLPLIGNRFGDWLCLRIDASGQASELVHWYHGGGDFIPFGKTLSEALLYDRCQSVRSDHTIWGEPMEVSEPNRSICSWIAEQLGVAESLIHRIEQSFQEGRLEEGLDALDEHGWCEVAVARDRIDLCLTTPLRRKADPKLAIRLGVTWEPELTRWLFDTELIPAPFIPSLEEYLGTAAAVRDRQDWHKAESIAVQLMEDRTDLEWPFAIAGWSAYRRGDHQQAIDRLWRGLSASVFSDQSTRFRSHWFDRRYGKFTAAILVQLSESLSDSIVEDPYWKQLSSGEGESIHQRIAKYWADQAKEANLEAAEQYDRWYRSGWDIGCHDIPMFDSILSQLQESAEQAGWKSRALLAEAYRSKLRKKIRR